MGKPKRPDAKGGAESNPKDDAALFRDAVQNLPARAAQRGRIAAPSREKGFYTPFADLKLPTARPQPTPAPKLEPPAPKLDSMHDALLFDDAMRQVEPLANDPRGRLGPVGASLEIGRPARRSKAEDEAEAYAELADLVDGNASFDIASTDEYIEGVADGIDRRLVKKLRRGEYAIQAHLDLHGLTQAEARVEVEQFLDDSRSRGRRCVLIVHGRGLHSKDQIPVLKEAVRTWLERGPVARAVLAFATARPHDGGAGAVYVLLRR